MLVNHGHAINVANLSLSLLVVLVATAMEAANQPTWSQHKATPTPP
jgi:hypothetical protein